MTVSNGLAWLLDDLTQRVPHVRHAVVLSNDGLVTGASGELDRPTAEHLAAVSSGFHSLAKGGRRELPVRAERRGRGCRAGRVRDDAAGASGGGALGSAAEVGRGLLRVG